MSPKPQARLSQIANSLNPYSNEDSKFPWNPDRKSFPKLQDLPRIPNAPNDAAWVWGPDDGLGRLNLLTPTRVLEAKNEIRFGEMIPVNLPLSVPDPPSFGREPFTHSIKTLAPGISYDDLYHLNTQSGTQWDGFRHFSHIPTKTFYNNVSSAEFTDTPSTKISMHHWAEHGIAGRGILLDYWGFATNSGQQYDPCSRHSISFADLTDCAKAQGLDLRPEAEAGHIKPGDILFVRSGWTATYNKQTPEERKRLAERKGRDLHFAGLAQEAAMVSFLHDGWFAAVAGDAPSFEVWPTKEKYHLHEYLLALWGVPIGEMLDLERLAERCREEGRWSFFFVSSPANVVGGVGSHVNGMAIL